MMDRYAIADRFRTSASRREVTASVVVNRPRMDTLSYCTTFASVRSGVECHSKIVRNIHGSRPSSEVSAVSNTFECGRVRRN